MENSPPARSPVQSSAAAALRGVRSPSRLHLRTGVVFPDFAAPATSRRRHPLDPRPPPPMDSSPPGTSATAALRRVRPPSWLLLRPGLLFTGLAAPSSSSRTSFRRASSSSLSTPSTSRPSAASIPELAVLSNPITKAHSHATMDELGDPLTVDELSDPVDIPVDVIHLFARRQPREVPRGVGGLGSDNMARPDAVLPEGAGGGDGLGENDDLVQAYMGTGFRDDGVYDTTGCFPKKAFFIASHHYSIGYLDRVHAIRFWIFFFTIVIHPLELRQY